MYRARLSSLDTIQTHPSPRMKNVSSSSFPIVLGSPSFLRFHSRSCSASQKYYKDTIRTREIDVPNEKGFSTFEHYVFPIGRLTVNLLNVHCVNGLAIRNVLPDNNYLFEFPLYGECQIVGLDTRQVSLPGDMFVVGPSQRPTEIWGDICQKLIVQIPQERFDQALAAEIGEAMIEFVKVPACTKDLGVAQWLRHMISLNLHFGEQNSLFKDASVGSQLERTLLAMLFVNIERNNLTKPEQKGRIVPHYLKRAQTYVRANYAKQITTNDIAIAACIGTRSLHYGFKQAFDTTPMSYLRNIRLMHARKALEAAEDGKISIAEIATSVGFVNFSHFSKLYRARYGERPSQTIRRPK